jgi:7-keto-8-aminopelargonate synthetase-like enzyme
LAHAIQASLALLGSPEGSQLRAALQANIELFHQATGKEPTFPTPICPIVLGSNAAALEAAQALENDGFLVPAIRYPTVPRGTARLRISLSAAHPPTAIHHLAQAISPHASPS